MDLLQELFAQGFLTEQKREDLQKEAIKTGKPEEEVILQKNIVPEEMLFSIKSKISNIPLKKVRAEEISSDVLDLIPEEASINYKMASIARNENSVQIGMVYPEDIAAQNALRFLANQENFTYQIYLITLSNLASLLKQHRNISIETKRALEKLNENPEESDAPIKVSSTQDVTEDAPIIKMVSVILRHAVEGNASDIHIEPGREKLTVRFRLNGVLHSSFYNLENDFCQ